MEPLALLFTNALLLGLRHGLDFDHLAAISDIVGTATASANGAAVGGRESIKLSTCYAVGHATVVACLGAIVICAGNFMPSWLGEIAEKLVGITLIALGAWLVFTLFSKQKNEQKPARRYGIATTFGVGMIHGIGAETGTQMLLLASIGGTHNISLAIGLLAAFVLGLLISNSAIAAAGLAGFTAARYKRLSTFLGIATALFSIGIGLQLLFFA